MKVLITVINKEEAEKVIDVGCDILDVKNPSEGSLGAPPAKVIRDVKNILPEDMKMSVAVGDVPNLPCTVSLAVLGAAQFKPDYIKIGLKGPKDKSEALKLLRTVLKGIKDLNIDIKIVAAGFADYQRVGSVNPLDIPDIAYKSGASVGMIDTAIKDGKNLLDFLSLEELKKFVDNCHDKGLEAALAGSLNESHVEEIAETGADIFGVRGMVCFKCKREARLEEELVKELVSLLHSF